MKTKFNDFLRENKNTEFKIYCDLDGVLTDFDQCLKNGFLTKFNKDNNTNIKNGWEFEDTYGKDVFWKNVTKLGIDFWSRMPWSKDGKKLWNFIKEYDVEILSTPSRDKYSKTGKIEWCERELGGDVKVNITYNKTPFSKPNYILIDDLSRNIDPWIEAGGIGILHKNTEDTIKKLKKINEKLL